MGERRALVHLLAEGQSLEAVRLLAKVNERVLRVEVALLLSLRYDHVDARLALAALVLLSLTTVWRR